MPEYVYTLRHMFNGLREGQTAPTFFTRDTEHLLGELPQKVLDEAVAKGWITKVEVPTVSEMREANRDLLEEAKYHRGGEKPKSGGKK